MKALIVIDYSNDFVADDGALTAGKPAQVLEDYLATLTLDFINKGDYVVFADDLHEKNDSYHPETKLFPPHNLRDTDGRLFYGKLNTIYTENKEKPNVYWIDKRRYSAFAGTDLDIRLRERHITELWLVGVVTDICVLHTAVDAYNLGYDIVVPEAGVASFNQKGHEMALNHFENSLGAKVIRLNNKK